MRDLTKQANRILKQSPELDKKYPERRIKAKTYVVDFQGLESKETPLNDFEKECLTAIARDPAKEIRLMIDITEMTSKFPATNRIILQKRKEGWTQEEIALFLHISRRSVIRKLNDSYKKLCQILK